MFKNWMGSILGFIVLFFLYHAAEYMIMFKNSAAGFLLFQGLFFTGAFIIAKLQFKKGFAAWGLGLRRKFIWQLLLGMVLGIVLYGVSFLFSLITTAETISFVPAGHVVVPALSLFVFGSFFSSVSEDILTRGYVLAHVKNRINHKLLIIVLSAFIYVLNHIYKLGGRVDTQLYLLLLGILFMIPLILTNQLWMTSGMHWAGNVFFYYTHELMTTNVDEKAISPNYLFCLVIVLMMPITYGIVKKSRFGIAPKHE